MTTFFSWITTDSIEIFSITFCTLVTDYCNCRIAKDAFRIVVYVTGLLHAALRCNSFRFKTVVSLRNGTAGRRGRQIACAWRTWQGYNLGVLSWSWLTSMFSGLLQKDLFKRKWSLAKSYFKQNYCHACHTRFAVFFPLPLRKFTNDLSTTVRA